MLLIAGGFVFLVTCLWCCFIAFGNAMEANYWREPSPIWPWFLLGTVTALFLSSLQFVME